MHSSGFNIVTKAQTLGMKAKIEFTAVFTNALSDRKQWIITGKHTQSNSSRPYKLRFNISAGFFAHFLPLTLQEYQQ